MCLQVRYGTVTLRPPGYRVAGTVLAFGFVVSFNSGWLILTGGPLIMVLAYTVRKVPFAVRSSSAILHQIDPSLEEASISLGQVVRGPENGFPLALDELAAEERPDPVSCLRVEGPRRLID